MEHQAKPKRRLNIVGRAARTKRIFARLRDGWAYDEIARDEGLSAERVRQIVSEVLAKRVIDRNEDHAHLQLERLAPALRLASEAVKAGDVRSIAPLIKVIDRIDRHQVKFVSKYVYGEEEREKLLDKLNRAADNLKDDPPHDSPAPAATNSEGAQGDDAKKTSAHGWLPASP